MCFLRRHCLLLLLIQQEPSLFNDHMKSGFRYAQCFGKRTHQFLWSIKVAIQQSIEAFQSLRAILVTGANNEIDFAA